MYLFNSKLAAAIIILYNPNKDFIILLDKIIAQYDYVVVVINDLVTDLSDYVDYKKIIVLNNKNYNGLAGGLNKGISYAIDILGVEFVTLFDQDSQIEHNFLEEILWAYKAASAENLKIAAIVPKIIDSQMGVLGGRPKAKGRSSFRSVVGSITSGTTISKYAVKKIGGMNEKLFIDSIDHEWCFRARFIGYEILKVDHVLMMHRIGDQCINIFGVKKTIHFNMIRFYYIIRNSLLLMRMDHVPFGWKLLEIFKTIRRIFGYFLLSRHKKLACAYIFSGLWDGIRGKSGPYEG